MNKNDFTIVLAGNPNCGKTAVFNALTGSRQRVGNWPGVTVEKKIGRFSHHNQTITVVDLPGIYSTSVASKTAAIDEKIACRYLLTEKVDVIVNIIDASNLERNLYLTLQLLEMKIPIILAVNMLDIAKKRGLKIDLIQLSQCFQCPVVGLIARQHQGIDQLKETIIQVQQNPSVTRFQLPLPDTINETIQQLAQQLSTPHQEQSNWFALRLLEEDQFVISHSDEKIIETAKQFAQQIEQQYQQSPDVLMAQARYAFVTQIVQQVTSVAKPPKHTFTQTLDKIVLHRYWGVPIFLGIMYLMFFFAINIGGAFQDFFDISSNTIFVDGFSEILTKIHCPLWLTTILANGIGKGINTTLTFIPVIGGMFLFLSFLEDSGYMARAAFVMDRLMRIVGLPGKSFVPMIVGFGCNVPAVMGARTLENPRDRILTVMMMPFMSCGARLAIFAVFASAFFPKNGATIIFILYLMGILIAVLTGLVLRKTVLPGKPAPLIMELPPYHLPRFTSLARHMWQRLKNFLSRAGRVIIPVCVILGSLNSIHLLSPVGRAMTPIFAPMGIQQNNWPATVGLTTGILAKEVVIGTLNTLYTEPEHFVPQGAEPFHFWQGLRNAASSIPQNFLQLGGALKNPIAASEAPHDMQQSAYGVMYHAFGGKMAAFAYLLFVLLYFPCISTMAVMRREIGGHWALFSVLWSTGLAYALAVSSYQLFSLALHPVASVSWISGCFIVLAIAIIMMRRYTKKNSTFSNASPRSAPCGSRCQLCSSKSRVG